MCKHIQALVIAFLKGPRRYTKHLVYIFTNTPLAPLYFYNGNFQCWMFVFIFWGYNCFWTTPLNRFTDFWDHQNAQATCWKKTKQNNLILKKWHNDEKTTPTKETKTKTKNNQQGLISISYSIFFKSLKLTRTNQRSTFDEKMGFLRSLSFFFCLKIHSVLYSIWPLGQWRYNI